MLNQLYYAFRCNLKRTVVECGRIIRKLTDLRQEDNDFVYQVALRWVESAPYRTPVDDDIWWIALYSNLFKNAVDPAYKIKGLFHCILVCILHIYNNSNVKIINELFFTFYVELKCTFEKYFGS